jgi:serine/threonine-protein kinase HipA
MARAAKNAAHELAASDIYRDDERGLVQQIARFVSEQADRLIGIAPMIPQVDPDLL